MDERKGVDEVRTELGRHVDAAFFAGDITVITKHGEPRAALVPYEWYREAETRRKAMVDEKRG